MNKHAVLVLLSAAVIILSSLLCFCSAETDYAAKHVFILPDSLLEIEAEAFVGTGAEVVVFPDGFARIDDHAFSDALRLTDVYIPASTVFIAETAFSLKDGLAVHGEKGSYADQWAKEHNVPFILTNIWDQESESSKKNEALHIENGISGQILNLEIKKRTQPETAARWSSKRLQDCPEFHSINDYFP